MIFRLTTSVCCRRWVIQQCMLPHKYQNAVLANFSVAKCRSMATSKPPHTNAQQKATGSELDVKRKSPYEGLSPVEKVKEATKDVTYFAFALAGLAACVGLLYIIGKELFSKDSPNGVYRRAAKVCKKSSEVIDVLGQPVKCYGEETARGRRRHVSCREFMSNGIKHIRLQFYIEGPFAKATVHVEMCQTNSNKYDTYIYLIVELDGHPRRTIILEDNR